MTYTIPLTWIETLEKTAREAGDIILKYREEGFETMQKGDKSPVTEADRAADRYISDVLKRLTPDISIISEEGNKNEQDAASGHFWCVDPLDGTKGFIRGEDEFTVNIGLIHDFYPILGIIVIPATGELFTGIVGGECYKIDASGTKRPLTVRQAIEGQKAAVVSAYHGSGKEEEMKRHYGVTSFVKASSSLKFCRIAEGEADIYPRFGPTMEWDTAAGHAIVLAAGGQVFDMETEKPLRYAKEAFRNGRFIAKT